MTATDHLELHEIIELETHANWRAADIGDVEQWTLRLTDAHHAELDATLARARSVTGEVLDVTVDDFPLPTLAPELQRVAQELVNGRGFARISALDVDRLGAEDASWMYWGIGMHLGEPWPRTPKVTCSATCAIRARHRTIRPLEGTRSVATPSGSTATAPTSWA